MSPIHELQESELRRYGPVVGRILDEIAALPAADPERIAAILRRHPRDGIGVFSKAQLARVYRWLCEQGERQRDEELLARLRTKPVRTVSGVAPVTVLTRPWPCPGRCIFCPTDVRMPKSYLHDEPGAMRAEQHGFDPYEQTLSRIEALRGNGHPVDKVELLVLGGTWSSYPRDYRERFVRRCLDAMNGGDEATSLQEAQRRNETARCRNVGLVIETRPDAIDPGEIRHLRALGVTKVQLGVQSLDDEILRRNARGHTVEQTRRAFRMLRAAGLKLVAHWMPNLHGATPASDLEDFARLWSDEALRPDELKIYSTALLRNAALMELYERGEYEPYEEEQVAELALACKLRTPRYCRINRIVRDIPSTNIVAGSRTTNLRQPLHARLAERGQRCACIRCREIRHGEVDPRALELEELAYRAGEGAERFLGLRDGRDRLAGYLRLWLPDRPGWSEGMSLGLPELEDAAVVREVHVVGPALALGRRNDERGQHRGLGSRLMARAESIATEAGYPRLAVISAVGTRPWYARLGYAPEGSYMLRRPLGRRDLLAAGGNAR